MSSTSRVYQFTAIVQVPVTLNIRANSEEEALAHIESGALTPRYVAEEQIPGICDDLEFTAIECVESWERTDDDQPAETAKVRPLHPDLRAALDRESLFD